MNWTQQFAACWPIENRRFPEITGEDNLTVFSYSGRVNSRKWRRQRRTPGEWRPVNGGGSGKSRSATVLDLQALTNYNLYYTTSWWNLLSDLHVPHEQWVLDRHFWCFICLLFTGVRHLPHVLTVPPTKACLLCATPTGMDLYIYI